MRQLMLVCLFLFCCATASAQLPPGNLPTGGQQSQTQDQTTRYVAYAPTFPDEDGTENFLQNLIRHGYIAPALASAERVEVGKPATQAVKADVHYFRERVNTWTFYNDPYLNSRSGIGINIGVVVAERIGIDPRIIYQLGYLINFQDTRSYYFDEHELSVEVSHVKQGGEFTKDPQGNTVPKLVSVTTPATAPINFILVHARTRTGQPFVGLVKVIVNGENVPDSYIDAYFKEFSQYITLTSITDAKTSKDLGPTAKGNWDLGEARWRKTMHWFAIFLAAQRIKAEIAQHRGGTQ